MLGLKSLTVCVCVMNVVAYGSFKLCDVAIHLIADVKLSASDGIVKSFAASHCSGESNVDLPAFLHSQMARDLPLGGIDGQSLLSCHLPKLSDRCEIRVNALKEWKGIGSG